MSDDGEWDFYPCVVDRQPASIFVNLSHEHARPTSSTSTRYWLRIQLSDAAPHRMGTSSEADALFPPEDAITASVVDVGLLFVGRLRSNGSWDLTFYGPAGRDDALNAIAREADLGGRSFVTGSKPDPEWTYYREFLLPDAERRQWMQDRRVVEAFEEHGDVHSIPRRVDHWAYFRAPTWRRAFVRDASEQGFTLEGTSDAPHNFGVQVFRTDSVELDHIHQVVMTLFKLADHHGGYYDGWEAPVEKPPPN